MIKMIFMTIFLSAVLTSCAVLPAWLSSAIGRGGPSGNERALFVSPQGDDARSGLSPDTAIKTIGKALELAKTGQINNIYLTVGFYKPGAGLDAINAQSNSAVLIAQTSGLSIRGGYDQAFNSVIGLSILDAENHFRHVVSVVSNNGLFMSGLDLRGGGLLVDSVSDLFSAI